MSTLRKEWCSPINENFKLDSSNPSALQRLLETRVKIDDSACVDTAWNWLRQQANATSKELARTSTTSRFPHICEIRKPEYWILRSHEDGEFQEPRRWKGKESWGLLLTFSTRWAVGSGYYWLWRPIRPVWVVSRLVQWQVNEEKEVENFVEDCEVDAVGSHEISAIW